MHIANFLNYRIYFQKFGLWISENAFVWNCIFVLELHSFLYYTTLTLNRDNNIQGKYKKLLSSKSSWLIIINNGNLINVNMICFGKWNTRR